MSKLENLFCFLILLLFYPLFISMDLFSTNNDCMKRANFILKENWKALVGKKE